MTVMVSSSEPLACAARLVELLMVKYLRLL